MIRQKERYPVFAPDDGSKGRTYTGSSNSAPTNGTSASGTRTLPSGRWWFSRMATSQRVVASVPLSVAAICGLPAASR